MPLVIETQLLATEKTPKPEKREKTCKVLCLGYRFFCKNGRILSGWIGKLLIFRRLRSGIRQEGRREMHRPATGTVTVPDRSLRVHRGCYEFR
jgi:hypothetical protein